jgi:hypothetical protein
MANQHMCCAAELAERVTKILALVTAFDEVSANQTAMEDAALQFDSLLQVRASQTHSEGFVISSHHCTEPTEMLATWCASCNSLYIMFMEICSLVPVDSMTLNVLLLLGFCMTCCHHSALPAKNDMVNLGQALT